MPTYLFEQDASVHWSIIRNYQDFEASIRELLDRQCFAWDVETNGLAIWTGSRIIGHAFAWRRPNGQIRAIYIPIRHQSCGMDIFEDMTQLDPEQVTQALKPILEGPALKVGHNLKFDVHMAYHDGIEVQPTVFDTMRAAQLIDENQRRYNLGAVLDRSGIAYQDDWKDAVPAELKKQANHLRMKPKEVSAAYGFSLISVDALGIYACQDAVYELRLFEYQQKFCGLWPDIWQMEMSLFWVCVDMERIGIPVDANWLTQLQQREQANMDELAPQIYALAGEEFTITNDNDLRRILFTKMELPSKGTTKKKAAERIDDDVLYELAKTYKIARLIRKYNASQKVVSTYTSGIIELVSDDGIVHAEFDPGGARTGRTSMRRPNLQNQPTRTKLGKDVRKAFVARPGFVRYCIDYSQIELRFLAHLSQDPLLLKIYREDLDAHSATAIEVFGTDGEVGGINMRYISKIINFSAVYGVTEYGLMKSINKGLPEGQSPINESQACLFLEGFYRKYSGIDRFRKSLWQQARQNGGLIWNMFGRPRRIPNVNHHNEWQRKAAERQIVSSMVQGSAADLMKYAMIACHQYLKSQTDCEAYTVLMIHDELQFDMTPDGSAKTVREMKRLMEQTCQAQMSVPIKADVEYFTDHWSNKKSMEF